MKSSENFERRKGTYRIDVGNLSLMYETETDQLNIGFINAGELTLKDLLELHYSTGNMINMIENEKHKGS